MANKDKDRREIPDCPKCGRSDATRIPETSANSQLRWFKCRWCSHLWSKGPRNDNH